MNKINNKTVLLFSLCCLMIAGCSKHDLEPEISLEDMAIIYVNQSPDGVSVFGGNLTRSDTLTAFWPELSADSVRWVADWELHPHSYQVNFDTVTDRGVPGLRAAMMSIRDTFAVTITLLIDADSVIEKTNYATAWGKATLVQLGRYGQQYHGWVMRKFSHRFFRGASGISPSLANVTIQRGTRTWALSTAEFNIEQVDSAGRGDSMTVRVATYDPTDLLFLNVRDGGTIRRMPMAYNPSRFEHEAGWHVSNSAARGAYYQAFVEAYDLTTLRRTDSLAVGVAAHTFVYRIK